MRQSLFSPAHAQALFNNLKRANTELAKKELFLQYLTTAFVTDEAAQRLIAGLAHGAERTIANIPRNSRITQGRADTQTETVIIEWEKDLSKTGAHAVDQLRDYLIGNWKSGQEYRFVLIATDGIKWRVYAPDWSHLKEKDFRLSDDFVLKEVRKFDLSDETASDLPFFLDEVLFLSRPKIATLDRIEADFGNTSSTFINSMRILRDCEDAVKHQSEMQTAYQQWRRFLSIAYGRFDNSPAMFMVHTYLSVFAKLLAFAVVGKKDPYHDDHTLKGILTGKIFEEQFLVERFVEDDFFHWVAGTDHFKKLKPMFREINRQISEYDFSDVKEDILKGVYQDLIDLDTRHALGEYYTPDWLCERVINSLPFEQASTFLDPACGSGSFLRAAIKEMRERHPSLTAEKLCTQICGIDIHPLSVQIAKTTILLTLADLIARAKRPVTLHVYLANSLLVPDQSADLFQSTFQMSIDNKTYEVNLSGLMSQDLFDQLITICDDLVSAYDEVLEKQRFISLTKANLPSNRDPALPQQLYCIYKALKLAKDAGRDSIWKFILQNSYKPVFLKERFDFVVGNPPWLTYAAISNAEYQSEIKRLADAYSVTPLNKANMPHLEIAAVFLAHSANYFLKPSGTISFVLPRSFMSADQHDQTRSGAITGLRLRSVWDLEGVSPLFRVPSCVMFAVRAADRRTENPLPKSGLDGLSFSGRLPRAQMHWKEVKDRILITNTTWYYAQLAAGNRRAKSALTRTRGEALLGNNAYADNFKQGATVVPRSFYFVELSEPDDKELTQTVFNLTPSQSMLKEAKPPWKEHPISGRLEGDYLFRTAVAKNVLPFALVKPLFVALPVIVEGKQGKRRFAVIDHDAIRARGHRFASRWFSEAEKLWNELRTEKAAGGNMSYLDRLDFQRGISDQDPEARFLVLYTGSATDANAVVVDRNAYAIPFIAEHKTYWYQTKSQREAHYVCAYLNSGYSNQRIKDFQSRGLFGPRDIHKTILKLPFPKFDGANETHVRLATAGSQASQEGSKALGADREADYDARSLGRKRAAIREALGEVMEEIDILVEQLSTGRTESAIRASGKGKSRRGRRTLPLFD